MLAVLSGHGIDASRYTAVGPQAQADRRNDLVETRSIRRLQAAGEQRFCPDS
jgi:hypothetical protein